MAQKMGMGSGRGGGKAKKGAARGQTTRDLELTDRDQEAIKGGWFINPKGTRRIDTRG